MTDEFKEGWMDYALSTMTHKPVNNPYQRGTRAGRDWQMGWLESMMADTAELVKHGIIEESQP